MPGLRLSRDCPRPVGRDLIRDDSRILDLESADGSSLTIQFNTGDTALSLIYASSGSAMISIWHVPKF